MKHKLKLSLLIEVECELGKTENPFARLREAREAQAVLTNALNRVKRTWLESREPGTYAAWHDGLTNIDIELQEVFGRCRPAASFCWLCNRPGSDTRDALHDRAVHSACLKKIGGPS